MTATALAHLLENAAQYSPPGSPIEDQRARSEAKAWSSRFATTVPASRRRPAAPVRSLLSRRRGESTRTSGTGMGLWIVRGLLAVEQGRVWAENCPDGGARLPSWFPSP